MTKSQSNLFPTVVAILSPPPTTKNQPVSYFNQLKSVFKNNPLKKVTLSFPLNFSPGFTTADLEWKLILILAGQHNLTGNTDGGQF